MVIVIVDIVVRVANIDWHAKDGLMGESRNE